MPINIARLGNPCERFPSLIKTSALPNYGTKHKPKCLETLDRVYKSDTTVPIPDNLTEALQKPVAPHADVLDDSKDWHPRCDQQVLGRVHPSIYPLVYGQSRILATATVGLNDYCVQRCGEGQTVELPEQDLVEGLGPRYGGHTPGGPPDNRWSHEYQWLTAELMTPKGAEDVK